MPGCISDSLQACNTKKCKLCKWPVSEMLNRPKWVGGSGWEFSIKAVLTMQDQWQWHQSCTSRNNSVNPLSGPWQRVFDEVIYIPQLYPVAASGFKAKPAKALKQTAKTAEVVFKFMCVFFTSCRWESEISRSVVVCELNRQSSANSALKLLVLLETHLKQVITSWSTYSTCCKLDLHCVMNWKLQGSCC